MRIEDIDPLREAPDAKDLILHALESHGLLWDESIVYQSQRSDLYEARLRWFKEGGYTYRCACSRKTLQERAGKHLPNCRDDITVNSPFAVRFKISAREEKWSDLIQKQMEFNLTEELDDCVLKRKENFYAYQLAVVCDDIDQDITHVVRGYDLIDSTPVQLQLYRALGATPPQYAHFPVVNNNQGAKLSKQNLSPAVIPSLSQSNLIATLKALNLEPPTELERETPSDILNWATQLWSLDRIVAQPSIICKDDFAWPKALE